ncbi:MAG: sulfotransferase, partial [Verrucomicrobiae bacterium]|nr:sulfotransferase [Verrucomicrobiae bacterium]
MEPRRVRRPILLLGAPRSGTTMLGNLLAGHPAVAYWEEPRGVWTAGNAYRRDDSLAETDLTPRIARRIDAAFADFLSRSGRARFLEKTPGNLLRLRFIRALYPDALLIHLTRDPRAVVRSGLAMLSTPPRMDRVIDRLRTTRPSDWPALAPQFFREVVARPFRGGRKVFWGPRPPGWRGWLDLPPERMLARQWRELVTAGRRDLETFPAENRCELRYEDFVRAPEAHLRRLLAFCGLEENDEVLRRARETVTTDRADGWRTELSNEQVAAVEDETGE